MTTSAPTPAAALSNRSAVKVSLPRDGAAAEPPAAASGLSPSSSHASTTTASRSASPFIRIRGAREHNLKNINLDIPRDQLVVITGLSGSGKSTLAFDTVFAEGQRKYMESLSTYARQFLDQLQKPDLDEIEGLPPTISIEQRGSSSNPRSTVATTTEIYDYLRVLFARAGTPHCWECGKPIASQSPTQIVDAVMSRPAGTKLMILSPLVRGQKGEHKDTFTAIHKQGFVRARVDGQITELPTPDSFPKLKKTFSHTIEAVVDRIVLKPEIRSRLADSIETALKLAQGIVIIAHEEPGAGGPQWIDTTYSEKFACPDHPQAALAELEPRLFSFNSPHGACPGCFGLGTSSEFDPDLIVPDDSLSLENGAIEAWRKHGRRMSIYYGRVLRTFARDFGIDYRAPFKTIRKEIRDILLHGTEAKGDAGTGTWFEGVIPNLRRRFESTESEYVKQRLHQYTSEQPCAVCHGARLRKEALAVRLDSAIPTDPADAQSGVIALGAGVSPASADLEPTTKKKRKSKNSAATTGGEATTAPETVSRRSPIAIPLPGYCIQDVTAMTVLQAKRFFDHLQLTSEGAAIAEPIVREIIARLGFMIDVGLDYLTLDRKTATLSGGEAQRIRLATQVGSGLVGVAYVLDEPTIGLHQRDNDRLIRTLRRLQQIGNTVIIVEHDEDCIRAADHRHRPRRRISRRQRRRPGPDARCAQPIPLADHQIPDRPARHQNPRAAPHPRLQKRHHPDRLLREQPQERRCRHPPGRARLRHRRLGLGQVDAGQPDPPAGPQAQALWLEGEGRRAQVDRQPHPSRQGHRDRPVAHRPNAAVQPRDLYGCF